MHRHPSSEFAPAKINLTLHVTGQREDGYHLLDSLVVFAKVGDWVSVEGAGPAGLTLAGPMAGGLSVGPDNLVLRAAALMGGDRALTLEKHLPVSSGIGGGSADAAATLRLLARETGRPLPAASDVLRLGADVPVCLVGKPMRLQGIGDRLTPVPPLPSAWLVLVNPRVPLSTPQVFRALTAKSNAPMPDLWPRLATVGELADFVTTNRNDLEPAAMSLVPEIAMVKSALSRQAGCLAERMSGSGTTCFGLFATEAEAQAAAQAVGAENPGWWVAAAPLV